MSPEIWEQGSSSYCCHHSPTTKLLVCLLIFKSVCSSCRPSGTNSYFAYVPKWHICSSITTAFGIYPLCVILFCPAGEVEEKEDLCTFKSNSQVAKAFAQGLGDANFRPLPSDGSCISCLSAKCSNQ